MKEISRVEPAACVDSIAYVSSNGTAGRFICRWEFITKRGSNIKFDSLTCVKIIMVKLVSKSAFVVQKSYISQIPNVHAQEDSKLS